MSILISCNCTRRKLEEYIFKQLVPSDKAVAYNIIISNLKKPYTVLNDAKCI